MIPLPKSAEIYFKKLEDEYNKEVLSITSMKTGFDYIVSLVVLALVPAIFEEMLFRGCLQKIMISLMRNAFCRNIYYKYNFQCDSFFLLWFFTTIVSWSHARIHFLFQQKYLVKYHCAFSQ
jgi:hypothetical protein